MMKIMESGSSILAGLILLTDLTLRFVYVVYQKLVNPLFSTFGSGGRDLSGNKRTSKEQSFDQKFEKLNAALRVSCLNGYPVRVVR